jgi:hypothetical protein
MRGSTPVVMIRVESSAQAHLGPRLNRTLH